MYLFWLGTVAMGAGAMYFWLMAGNVPRVYRTVMVVAGIICAVACFHYFRMSNLYIDQLATIFDVNGDRIPGKAIGQFPTAYRYIDWLITVPLLVLEFPLLLNTKRKSGGLFASLVGASIVMLVLAWIAEASPVGLGTWWIAYIASCLAWLYIVFVLFSKMSQSMATQPEPIRVALSRMRLFVLVGWTIYPIGFLLALLGPQGESAREICYNIADVINKVLFGLACYQGVKAIARDDDDHLRALPITA